MTGGDYVMKQQKKRLRFIESFDMQIFRTAKCLHIKFCPDSPSMPAEDLLFLESCYQTLLS